MLVPAPSSSDLREEYRSALSRIEQLNGNMTVLARLMTMLRDTETGIEDAAKLLQTDGALCANVIRISNSVMYGQGSRCVNLQEALMRVGYKRLLSLIGAAFSKQLFMKDLSAYGLSANDYWASSYFCGVFLEIQALRGGQSADTAYMLGLLHSIGRVVINELLVKTKVEIYWDRSLPCQEWEDILIGFRHDEAGATLLRKWKFDSEVYERVSNQHSPKAKEEDRLVQILDFSRCCVELNQFRIEDTPWQIPTDHLFEQDPDFDPEQIALDVERARKTCLLVQSSFKTR